MPGTTRRRAVSITLAAVLTCAVAGCSSADGENAASTPSTGTSSPATATPSSPTSTGSASPTVRTIEITVNGKDVTPAPSRVKVAPGETLRLVVTADHDDELHAHGFEVEEKVRAGVPTTVDLTTKEPGLYEVEMHHPELRLLQVQVG